MSGFGRLHEFWVWCARMFSPGPTIFSWNHYTPSSHPVSAASLFHDSILRKFQNLSTFPSWYIEHVTRPHPEDLVLQVPSIFSPLLVVHIHLCQSLSQQLSGFLLNYWCSVNSHITFSSQTCYGLMFLRREAPKTYNVLERPWERVQLTVHMIPLQMAGRWSVGRR